MKTVIESSQENSLPDKSLNLEGLRIVVVDDDVDTLNLLALIHIAMPEMDGYTLIRQVGALEVAWGGNLLAIALTAFAGESDRQKIISAGFQKHLTKPIDSAELVAAISDLTKRSNHD